MRKGLNLPIKTLKMEEEAGHKLRNAEGSRSWKRPGTGFPFRVSRMDHNSVSTLILTETCMETFTYRTVWLQMCVVLRHEVCGKF